MKVDLKKLHKLEDTSIQNVKAMLTEGSPFGGKSLVSLIEAFKEHGPYSAAGDRIALARHLQRCLEAVHDMNATIVARAHVNPNRCASAKPKLPKKASASWSVERLVLWAAEESPFVNDVLTRLTCEGLPEKDVPKEARQAVRTFRHLNSAAREQRVRAILVRRQK